MSKIQGYSVEEILIGTYYRSSVRPLNDGLIVEAVKRDDVWLNGAEAYAVRVRPTYNGRMLFNDFWATIGVNN
jgi:hypothetical protein